jgi:hypothetical protein
VSPRDPQGESIASLQGHGARRPDPSAIDLSSAQSRLRGPACLRQRTRDRADTARIAAPNKTETTISNNNE